MLPCLTCIHDIPAKPSLGCPPCLYFACGLIKDVGGHPMMHHGACMVRLTRLPPSEHVLMLSTPLFSKIKNNFKAMGELKHKFREVFKALKTNVSRKIFPTTFMLVSPILYASIS
jgi:hypothetical protein